MKKLRRAFALVLALALIVSLSGCMSGGNSKYIIVTRLEKVKLCVAFRDGDKAGDAVIAAINVLAAEGELSRISRDWFRSDAVILKGSKTALEDLGWEPEERTFIVGYDKAHLPFSGENESGQPIGFDIEAARAVCELLGWKLKFLAIDVSEAAVELKSGNVDCVWGGYSARGSTKDLRFSPPYMDNTIIIASLKGSGIASEKALSGATLGVSDDGQFFSVLESYPDVAGRPGFTIKLPGGAQDSLQALDDGSCDAVVTDIASINYRE